MLRASEIPERDALVEDRIDNHDRYNDSHNDSHKLPTHGLLLNAKPLDQQRLLQ